MKKILTLICTSLISIDNVYSQELVHNISKDGLNFIKKQESFAAKPYFDHKSFSIGYGVQKLCNGKKVTAKTKPMTEEEATKHLQCVIDVKNDLLMNYYIDNKMEISQEMHDSILSFVYNLGSYAALRSSVMKHLHNKQCFKAVVSMKSFNKASGVTLKGLVIRRELEAKQLLDGCKKVNEMLGYEYYNVIEVKAKKKGKKHAK